MNAGEIEPWAADRTLAARCLAGEEGAWAELVNRHAGRIYSHCRLAGLAPQDAEDTTQEVLLSALRSLPSYHGCSLSTWLYGLTRRRVADHFRSSKRRVVTGGEDPVTIAVDDRGDPESVVASTERGVRTRRALAGLSEPSRSILTAYYLYEVPVREIAEEMSMPVNTVKSHLHRGRKALRRILEKHHDL